jgi:proline iminopeptidase
MRLVFPLALFGLGLALACSDGDQTTADGGEPQDAPDDFDAGVPRDGGPDAGRRDGGRRDVGFDDPATVIQGPETINGLETFIHAQGTLTSTLPPIFLIHTGPQFGHEYWPPHMRFLLPARLLVYYDVRGAGRSGYGSSATTTTVTADQHALDLEDLRLHIGTAHGVNVEKIDLIGHGYGAAIASLYTAAHPATVEHLILTNPYPATARQLAEFKSEALERLTSAELEFIHQLEMHPDCRGDPGQCEIDIWQYEGPHYMCEENRPLWRMMLFEHGSPLAADYVEFDLRSKRYDWGPILETITVPTTVISGVCDPIPPVTAQTYTSSISGAVHHVLMNSGHFPFVEQSAEYQRLVLEALQR